MENTQNIVYQECNLDFIDWSNIIKGHDFNKSNELIDIINSYALTGIQADNLSQSIQIIRKMLENRYLNDENRCHIYLGVSNSVIQQQRSAITYLCQHKLVDVIAVSAACIEQDIFQSLQENNKEIKEIIRDLIDLVLTKENLKDSKKIISVHQFIQLIGKHINKENSFVYQCYLNQIPIYCAAIQDGIIGSVFYDKYLNKEEIPTLDLIEQMKEFFGDVTKHKITGAIILGGGYIKHQVFNANLMKNGSDYCVVINTGEQYDCSDTGADIEESITWGKVKNGEGVSHVKVHSDVSLVLPLVMYSCFKQQVDSKKGKN